MRDKTYTILKKMISSNCVLHEAEIAKYTNCLTTIDSLVSRGLVDYGITEEGAPDGTYFISNNGRDYVMQRLAEKRKFIVDFFSHFITGLVTGSVGVLVIQYIISLLSKPVP